MQATAVQPSTNGVIKIARRGKVKFELEDGKPFELDVVSVHDDVIDLDWSFRDVDGQGNGVVPQAKRQEWKKAIHDFWQAVVNDGYAAMQYDVGAPSLTRAETEALAHAISEEVKKLRDFFLPKKDASSPSPSSTEAGSETRFSQ